MEQRGVPRHERLELGQRRIARDARRHARGQAADRDAVLPRRGVVAEHASVRFVLGGVERLDALVERVGRPQRACCVREPLVAGPVAAHVRAHVTGAAEQRERRLEHRRGRVRCSRAVEVTVAARDRAGRGSGPFGPGDPPRHRGEQPIAPDVLVVADLRVEVLPAHDDLPARDQEVLERERPADVRVRPARQVVPGEEDHRAVVLELRERRPWVARRSGSAVEDVEAQAEPRQRGRVDRPEVGSEVAIPVDQEDVLRDGRILDADEVRDRVRLAAAGDLEEALVVACRGTGGRQVDVERRAAGRSGRERRRRRERHRRVADDLADVERVARRAAALTHVGRRDRDATRLTGGHAPERDARLIERQLRIDQPRRVDASGAAVLRERGDVALEVERHRGAGGVEQRALHLCRRPRRVLRLRQRGERGDVGRRHRRAADLLEEPGRIDRARRVVHDRREDARARSGDVGLDPHRQRRAAAARGRDHVRPARGEPRERALDVDRGGRVRVRPRDERASVREGDHHAGDRRGGDAAHRDRCVRAVVVDDHGDGTARHDAGLLHVERARAARDERDLAGERARREGGARLARVAADAPRARRRTHPRSSSRSAAWARRRGRPGGP